MKNRSNIAASILQNPKLLKDVYTSSQDSEGSAKEELDKYLDSIEGKIAQFTNELQEFWYNLISSETIKWFIDAGTTIVDVIGDIVGALGEVGTILATTGIFFGGKSLIKNSGGRVKKFTLKVIKYATESFSREVCEFWCTLEW